MPVETSSLLASESRAQQAGIGWISYAVEMPGSNGGVLFSPEQSGQLMADDAVAWINSQPTPPKVLVLTATTSPSTMGRTDVPIAAIKAKTKAEIVAVQDASDQETGLQVTESVLSAHPDLRVVIGFNDDGALGAMQAFTNAGIGPAGAYIGGQDGSLDALQAIKSGTAFKATSALRLKDVGYAVVDTAIAHMGGDTAKATATIPAVMANTSTPDLLDELIVAYGSAQ